MDVTMVIDEQDKPLSLVMFSGTDDKLTAAAAVTQEMAMSITIAMSLDLKGLSCPMPIIKTAKAMKELAPGQLLEAFATDPGSVPDFKAWAQATGNPLVESSQDGGVFRFVLRKKEI
jgi:tRNA 2-thiouridine synthesizing protein A